MLSACLEIPELREAFLARFGTVGVAGASSVASVGGGGVAVGVGGAGDVGCAGGGWVGCVGGGWGSVMGAAGTTATATATGLDVTAGAAGAGAGVGGATDGTAAAVLLSVGAATGGTTGGVTGVGAGVGVGGTSLTSFGTGTATSSTGGAFGAVSTATFAFLVFPAFFPRPLLLPALPPFLSGFFFFFPPAALSAFSNISNRFTSSFAAISLSCLDIFGFTDFFSFLAVFTKLPMLAMDNNGFAASPLFAIARQSSSLMVSVSIERMAKEWKFVANRICVNLW